METESAPDLLADEAYWQSLLNDVEARETDRGGNGGRPAMLASVFSAHPTAEP